MGASGGVRFAVALVIVAAASSRDDDGAPSVRWHAPFFSGGGYCSEATTFVVALAAAGVDVGIEQHGDGFNADYVDGLDDATVASLRELSGNAARTPDVVVCHSEPGAWHVLGGPSWASSPCPRSRSSYAVGRTMFETDRLPDGWARRLNAMDEIWVPTEFHRGIFEAAGVRRVEVVGEPVDTALFAPGGPRLTPPGVEDGDFLVLSVFKWERRKGWDVLLRAWSDAALGGRAVLVLVTSAYHGGDDFEGALAAFARDDLGADRAALGRVVVLRSLPTDDLAALYRRADLVALPTRGEGWGRPHVEAMASGTPVAATNWSGPTAFLDGENGYPLRYAPDLAPVGEGPFADHRWAEPDAAHLAAILRRARDDPSERARLGANARASMVERFAPAVLAREVQRHLHRIHLHENPAPGEL